MIILLTVNNDCNNHDNIIDMMMTVMGIVDDVCGNEDAADSKSYKARFLLEMVI